jgi:protein TonB
MFSTLESNWDQSARRGWTTLASFTIQAFSLGLLVIVSLIWIERPPQLHLLQITLPSSFTRPAATEPWQEHRRNSTTVSHGQARSFNFPVTGRHAEVSDIDNVPPAPELGTIDSAQGGRRDGVLPGNLGVDVATLIPARPAVRPAAAKPVHVSNIGIGNLVFRVQPNYPALARQARIQGSVELRAIISKRGTIENLVVLRGHPMLSAAAIEAVRQWRYRPYLLNNEPVEVETEVTVNFTLSGGS